MPTRTEIVRDCACECHRGHKPLAWWRLYMIGTGAIVCAWLLGLLWTGVEIRGWLSAAAVAVLIVGISFYAGWSRGQEAPHA